MRQHATPAKLAVRVAMLCAGFLSCVATPGCAAWKGNWSDADEQVGGQSSTQLRHHPSTIAIESNFTSVPANSADWSTGSVDPATGEIRPGIWQWVDETAVAPEVRRVLIDNGIRVGRVSNAQKLDERLGENSCQEDVVDEFMKHAKIAGGDASFGGSIPLRIGKRHELPTDHPIPGLHVAMARLDGQTVGQTLRDPQYLFAMTPRKGATDAEIMMHLRVEIQHGDMKQNYAAAQMGAGIRIQHRREAWSLPELEFAIALTEGDSILIAPTDPPVGIGQAMLTGTTIDGNDQIRVLRLRAKRIPKPQDLL